MIPSSPENTEEELQIISWDAGGNEEEEEAAEEESAWIHERHISVLATRENTTRHTILISNMQHDPSETRRHPRLLHFTFLLDINSSENVL